MSDVEDLQRQVENISNRLDSALHKLAEYQRVVAGAVRDGVYRNNDFWWRELRRLEEEQAGGVLPIAWGGKKVVLKNLLETIRNETVPLAGHTDPGALNDCWAEVFEILESLGHGVLRTPEQIDRLHEQLDEIVEVGAGGE